MATSCLGPGPGGGRKRAENGQTRFPKKRKIRKIQFRQNPRLGGPDMCVLPLLTSKNHVCNVVWPLLRAEHKTKRTCEKQALNTKAGHQSGRQGADSGDTFVSGDLWIAAICWSTLGPAGGRKRTEQRQKTRTFPNKFVDPTNLQAHVFPAPNFGRTYTLKKGHVTHKL